MHLLELLQPLELCLPGCPIGIPNKSKLVQSSNSFCCQGRLLAILLLLEFCSLRSHPISQQRQQWIFDIFLWDYEMTMHLLELLQRIILPHPSLLIQLFSSPFGFELLLILLDLGWFRSLKKKMETVRATECFCTIKDFVQSIGNFTRC